MRSVFLMAGFYPLQQDEARDALKPALDAWRHPSSADLSNIPA
jgi:hypothetical protein